IAVLEVRRDVDEARERLDLRLEELRVPGELGAVGALERELVGTARHLAADRDGRRVLEEDADPGNAGELRPEFLDDLVDALLAIAARLQEDEAGPGIDGRARVT